MSEPLFDSYHLTAAAIKQLATQPIDGLKPELTTLNEVAPYTALDDFDQSLRNAGQLLLAAQETLELIDNNGRTTTQTVHGPVAFQGDIPEGELSLRLKHLSALRRLQPIGTGLWQRAVLTFSDETQTVHCRIDLLFLTGEPGRAAAVAVLPSTTQYPESIGNIRGRVLGLNGTKFNG